MLFDTDVLIWVMRGSARAAAALEEAEGQSSISILTYMELLRGARDRGELRAVKAFLRDEGFQTLPLTENIGNRAAVYLEEYGLSSGLSVIDSLIAATAAESGLELCTGNEKHYGAIADLALRVFRP